MVDGRFQSWKHLSNQHQWQDFGRDSGWKFWYHAIAAWVDPDGDSTSQPILKRVETGKKDLQLLMYHNWERYMLSQSWICKKALRTQQSTFYMTLICCILYITVLHHVIHEPSGKQTWKTGKKHHLFHRKGIVDSKLVNLSICVTQIAWSNCALFSLAPATRQAGKYIGQVTGDCRSLKERRKPVARNGMERSKVWKMMFIDLWLINFHELGSYIYIYWKCYIYIYIFQMMGMILVENTQATKTWFRK